MNIAVIGGGPGGYEAAIYAAKLGAQVTLIEKGNVGGTCLNAGCIPTKALLKSTDMLYALRKAGEFGIAVMGEILPHYEKAIQRKNKVVAGLVGGVEYTLNANGVTLLRGRGSLRDSRTVVVEGVDGSESVIHADTIILATGSTPTVLPPLARSGEQIITSDELLAITEAPASIIIVGGGVIGCEFGQLLHRFGSEVTIVELQPHLLLLEDGDTAAALERQFRREKIKCICGVEVQSASAGPGGAAVTLSDGRELAAEKLLVAVGRKPYTQGLGLDSIGISPDPKGFIPM